MVFHRHPEEGRAGIVRGKVEAPHLAIHVIDSGKGLNAEQLDHVFEPFLSRTPTILNGRFFTRTRWQRTFKLIHGYPS